MNYVGLVPSESTTGQQRRQGSITKTGSGHARRLLVEAAWHYRPRPRIGKALSERQARQPAEAVAISWSAQRRRHRHPPSRPLAHANQRQRADPTRPIDKRLSISAAASVHCGYPPLRAENTGRRSEGRVETASSACWTSGGM